MLPRPGARLGPYELFAPLGRGGTGEVFRARDTWLGQDVAINDPALRSHKRDVARAPVLYPVAIGSSSPSCARAKGEETLETRVASIDGRELGTVMTSAVGATYTAGWLFSRAVTAGQRR